MRTVAWAVPAVVAGDPITIPTTEPNIDAVVAAIITRLPSALTLPNHLAAAIQAGAAVSDHAVHAHALVSQGLGAPVTNPLGLPAGLNSLEDAGAAALHTVPGAGATGVQNNAAAQAHAYGAGAPVVHGANVGADPRITPTVLQRVNTRQIRFTVTNTVLGDILNLSYFEVGERVLVS